MQLRYRFNDYTVTMQVQCIIQLGYSYDAVAIQVQCMHSYDAVAIQVQYL